MLILDLLMENTKTQEPQHIIKMKNLKV